MGLPLSDLQQRANWELARACSELLTLTGDYVVGATTKAPPDTDWELSPVALEIVTGAMEWLWAEESGGDWTDIASEAIQAACGLAPLVVIDDQGATHGARAGDLGAVVPICSKFALLSPGKSPKAWRRIFRSFGA